MAAQQLITIVLTSGTQWRVPANWNSNSNSIKCFGAGGGGGRASPSNPCLGSPGAGGGAAGAYSEVVNQIYTPGALISYAIGLGGAGGVALPQDGGTGGDTSIKTNDNTNTACLAKGGTGGQGQAPGNGAGSGGTGGAANSGIGTTKFSGGNGGAGTAFGGGGGGGGAAGPNGPGAKGGSGAAGPGTIGGSGGGGANNGSAGTDATTTTGAPGGNGRGGTGGGAASGGSATPDLGGGGGGGDAFGGSPGKGAQDTLFRDNSGGPNNGLTAGPSGGGGASQSTTIAGTCGFGGGGGGTQSDSLSNIAAPGGNGFIVIQYTPATAITPPPTDIWLYSGAPIASDIMFHGFGSADVWLLTGLAVPSDIALVTRGVLRTSYANNGGLGDRRREIVVTSDIATSVPDGGTDWLVMINGNLTANSTNARQPNTSNDNGDRNITFDWGVNARIIIDEVRYYMSATDTFGSWTLEGSNNGTGWTQLGSAFTFGGVAGANKVAVPNSTGYRYYRLHTTSFQGGGGSGSWLEEVEFKLLDITPQGSRPSYYNRFGFGDRGLSSAAPITVTTDATLAGGAVQNVVDGDNSANTNAKGFTFNATQAGVNVRFDFTIPVAIDTIHWYQSSAQTHGTWKLQGSTDASSWIDVGSSFTLGGNAGVTTYQMGGNLNAYRYYRIIGAPGSTSAIPIINEVEFRIFSSSPSPIVITTLSGDGLSAGVGTVTAVGAAVIPSDGSSAGVGTVTAVGAAVIPGDGASTGVGSASAVGAAVMPSTGSSDGTSTATAASLTIIQGAGLAAATDIWLYPGAALPSDIKLYGLGAGAAGLGIATAVGVAIIPSAGSAAGVATVTAVGAAVMPSTGSAAGTSTVTAVGAAVMPSTGSAAGVGTATSVGVAVMPGDGSAAGVATASAVGVSVMPTVGNADGTSTVTGVGADGNQVTTPVSLRLYVGWTPAADVVLRAVDSNGSQWGVGSSAGAGSAAAVGAMVMPSTGSAAGLGAAAAVGVAVVPGAGAASGSGVAAGVGVAIWRVSGAAAGTSSATAIGVIIIPAAGLAQGTSTADASGINGAGVSEPNSVSIVQLLDHSVTVLLGTGGFTLIVPDFVVNLSLPLTSQNVTVPDRSLSVNLSDRSIIVTIL